MSRWQELLDRAVTETGQQPAPPPAPAPYSWVPITGDHCTWRHLNLTPAVAEVHAHDGSYLAVACQTHLDRIMDGTLADSDWCGAVTTAGARLVCFRAPDHDDEHRAVDDEGHIVRRWYSTW